MTRKPTESQEQRALFMWIRLQPEIKNIAYSIPNGSVLAGDAKKRAIQMNWLKKTGLLVGVPDVCIPVPRGRYSALYIELKVITGGKASTNQYNVMESLRGAGNKVEVCLGCEEAINVIKDYLCQK